MLHPYSTIDLDNFEISFIDPNNYLVDENYIFNKVNTQLELEKKAIIEDVDLKKLSKKIKRHRYILYPLFSKGIVFFTDKENYIINTLSGKVKLFTNSEEYSFGIQLPSQALKDAISYDHFGDLGITMFTILMLNRTNNPKFIYVFFILMTFDDYKHFFDFQHFFRWIKSIVNNYSWDIPHLVSAVNIKSIK